MLQLFRRHTQKCVAANGIARHDRTYRRCQCPIHAEGTLRIDGYVRVATREYKWPDAETWKRLREDAGTLKVSPSVTSEPKTLREELAEMRQLYHRLDQRIDALTSSIDELLSRLPKKPE